MKFARNFYVSPEWKKCREGFIKARGGLCERCAAEGFINAGTQVHHKIRLTAGNLTKPEIALNWDNLELLCDTCHEREHGKHRMRTDESGHFEI